VLQLTAAAIWEMFLIACVWWWYFLRLLTRTAEVHMKTTQTKVVFLISYAKRWLGSNSNDAMPLSGFRLQACLGYISGLAYGRRWVTNAFVVLWQSVSTNYETVNTYCIGIWLHHLPSWFVRLNRLQTSLLGFIKLVSDLSNWLHETGKSQTGLGLVWQIDYTLMQ